jgi:hypothetical protein
MANEPSKGQSNPQHTTRGRPKKSLKQSKAGYLGFRLPEDELEAVEAAALAAGETVSEFVRKAIAARIKERKPLLPASSLSFVISPVRIDDNKLPMLEGTSTTEVKPIAIRFHLAEDDPTHKEA